MTAADAAVERRLVVISGPGGVGKGTVVRRLVAQHPELEVTVSTTTRAPRDGEVDGTHYHFVDDAEFDRMVEAGEFVEWAEFGGRRYGTPWRSLDRARSRAATVVLEIDVQGALQVRERFLDALLIFLTPPSTGELRRRLEGRGSDDPERIAQRLAIAEWEMAQTASFDHVLVNDTVDGTVAAIGRILGY